MSAVNTTQELTAPSDAGRPDMRSLARPITANALTPAATHQVERRQPSDGGRQHLGGARTVEIRRILDVDGLARPQGDGPPGRVAGSIVADTHRDHLGAPREGMRLPEPGQLLHLHPRLDPKHDPCEPGGVEHRWLSRS